MHKIDSHHHLWDLTVRPQTWQVGNKFDPVRRNFDISDLKSAISDTGITHTYLVQTVMNYDETPELLVTANENEIILYCCDGDSGIKQKIKNNHGTPLIGEFCVNVFSFYRIILSLTTNPTFFLN